MVFVGMQPVFTQVPPNRCRSTTATDMPAAERRLASGGPAWPVPMMIASNWLFMSSPEKSEARLTRAKAACWGITPSRSLASCVPVSAAIPAKGVCRVVVCAHEVDRDADARYGVGPLREIARQGGHLPAILA